MSWDACSGIYVWSGGGTLDTFGKRHARAWEVVHVTPSEHSSNGALDVDIGCLRTWRDNEILFKNCFTFYFVFYPTLFNRWNYFHWCVLAESSYWFCWPRVPHTVRSVSRWQWRAAKEEGRRKFIPLASYKRANKHFSALNKWVLNTKTTSTEVSICLGIFFLFCQFSNVVALPFHGCIFWLLVRRLGLLPTAPIIPCLLTLFQEKTEQRLQFYLHWNIFVGGENNENASQPGEKKNVVWKIEGL